jgi:predicted O-methyltransferase YrrM
LKPSVVVETGVNEGYSTQAILSAMNLNGIGKLYSIDLPNVSNAPDSRSYNLNSKEVGYMVPIHLRNRWELRIGDAKLLLSPLLSELGEIDIFLHDSLHTYDHMLYEYREAWQHIKVNGLLVSHDIQMNDAFKNFVQKNRGEVHLLSYNIGIARKND